MATLQHIIILSNDFVFTELMSTMFKQFLQNADIIQLHSFNSIREEKKIDKCDLILLGDIVEGARGSQVLEYLRLKRLILCPIAYFCDDVPELMEKSIRRGANFCYSKPFKPDVITLDLIQKLNTIQIGES